MNTGNMEEKMQSNGPSTWLFPTEDPEWVEACDYNPQEQQYNLNCRRVRIGDISPGTRRTVAAVAHPGEEVPAVASAAARIPWPNFRGHAIRVGTSPSGRVTVYVDAALGQPALRNARDLLADADRVVHANDLIFGTNAGRVNVIIFALGGVTDGTGGADHMGCDYVTGNNIEVCAAFGNSLRVSALFEAELSECNMRGNLCGVSTGEALSRWCAASVSNNALGDFATAPSWFDNGGHDFVSQTFPSDGDEDSTGCGMAFISWLLSQNISLGAIAQAMVSLGTNGTFSRLYANLTHNGANTAYPAFMTAVRGLAGGVTSDDPFGAMPSLLAPVVHRTSRRLLLPVR